MCGILGFFGDARCMPSAQQAGTALRTLNHRGPDASGLLQRPDLGLTLGHARLSIIDPTARSDQPFDTDRCVLVFNGEIYNHRLLRGELQKLGAEFRTSSDTEVIAIGYRFWGLGVFERLRGMFALALYDKQEKKLHLVRDEFGIKPLCFLRSANEIVFASEVKAIAALRRLSLNDGVLVDSLSWGFQMENASLYADVHHLEPGCALTLSYSERGGLKCDNRVVWRASQAYLEVGSEPTAESLRNTIEASVEDHLMADVPVALALSGGLDSSIVAAAASRRHSGLQAFTFTLAPETDPEVTHAALVCRHFGLEHRVARMRPCKVDGWLRQVAWHLEEPVANVNALLSFGLGAIVRAHGFKVILVGEGADELFGGYPWYRYALDPALSRQPSAVFDAYRKRRAQSSSVRFLRQPTSDLAADRLEVHRERFKLTASINSPLHGFFAFDHQTQLQYSQLLRVDRMFMAHGVEARVPFLYRSVLQASAAIPAKRLMPSAPGSPRMEKLALAEAFADVLPGRIAARPKFGEQGTVDIWGSWLARGLTDEFDRCLAGDELKASRELLEPFIDWKAVAAGRSSSKEKFSLSLLLESVNCLMLSPERPESESPVLWDIVQ